MIFKLCSAILHTSLDERQRVRFVSGVGVDRDLVVFYDYRVRIRFVGTDYVERERLVVVRAFRRKRLFRYVVDKRIVVPLEYQNERRRS